MRVQPGIEVLEPPARPLPPQILVLLEAFLQGRDDAAACRHHAFHDLVADAAHGASGPVAHVVQQQHHSARRQPPQVAVALQDQRLGAVPRRGDGGRKPRGAATHDHDIGLRDDRHLAGGLVNGLHGRPSSGKNFKICTATATTSPRSLAQVTLDRTIPRSSSTDATS